MQKRKPQKREFETQGNPVPGQHYLVENRRIVSQQGKPIRQLVDRGRYFTIFAPRQMGKTTFFVEFANEKRRDPLYVPILLNFQIMKHFDSPGFYARIQKSFTNQLNQRLQAIKCEKVNDVVEFCRNTRIENHASFQYFFADLNAILEKKKVVIFIDEFDAIPEAELENFLNVLRTMYLTNKVGREFAVYSCGLVGVRNVAQLNVSGNVSPFNIADQVKVPPFTLAEVENLYGQYTVETGQPFTPEACRRIHYETGGQPY